MIFKIFLPKNSAEKLAFLAQNKAKLFKILIMTLDFKKNCNFLPKICKIAEISDHNIDPRVGIQKPVLTYDIVSYYRKAVCPNLFAALPNIFYHLNFTIFIRHCRCHF
jgi:hypothetical protein